MITKELFLRAAKKLHKQAEHQGPILGFTLNLYPGASITYSIDEKNNSPESEVFDICCDEFIELLNQELESNQPKKILPVQTDLEDFIKG